MFYLNPCHWYALSTYLPTKSAWLKWDGEFESSSDNPTVTFQVKQIPMIQARRMSMACKMACEVMLSLLEEKNSNIEAAVFVSQHGELARSTKIIQSIIQKQPVSPTDFSMSVHNTASGLSSILSQNKMETSSVSACSDGFHQGLFEVQAFFAQGAQKVILLDFDDHVPNIYDTGEKYQIEPYACGFVFSSEKKYCYHRQQSSTKFHREKTPQSLQFLKNVLDNQDNFAINSTKHCWLWEKS